jgi:Gram-negative porin
MLAQEEQSLAIDEVRKANALRIFQKSAKPGVLMKKHFSQTVLFIALSAAGLAAQAEGFTFSTLVDVGVQSSRISGGGSSTSLTEFATGALGPTLAHIGYTKSMNGLTAGVDLEEGFNLNSSWNGSTSANSAGAFGSYDGNTGLFNREASLSLGGDFGNFKAGRQYSAALHALISLDPKGVSNSGSILLPWLAMGGPLFDQGSVSYGNKFGSSSVLLEYIMPNQKNTATGPVGVNGSAATGKGLSANYLYKEGDFGAGLGVYNMSNNSTSGLPSTLASGFTLGANYKVGNMVLNVIDLQQKQNSPGVAGFTATNLGQLNTFGVGGTYNLDAKTSFAIGAYNSKGSDGLKNVSADILSGTVTYELMPSVKLYGIYTNIKNSSGATAFNLPATGSAAALASGFLLTTGQTANVFNLGLQYAF